MAIYEQKPTGDAMHYVYTDYLGSLRCITDASGNVEQKLGFDAWGNRRDPVGGGKTSLSPMLFSRGFTGHEHLEEFGLINMNGRVYDPMLGMFISPDNYLQAPDFTQNFNRYAYCLNNPLRYTDPDGEWVQIVVGALIGGLEGGSQSLANGDSFWEGFWKGAVAGAVSSVVGSCAGAAVSSALGNSYTMGGMVLNGAVTGAVAGFAGGFAGGAANAWLNGATFEGGLNRGLIGGGYGAIGGSIMGSLSGFERYNDYWEARSNRYWTARGGGDRYTNLPNKYKSSSSIDPRFLQRSSLSPLYTESYLVFDGENLCLYDRFNDGSARIVETWQAQSGSGAANNGHLPNGVYTVSNGRMRTDNIRMMRDNVEFSFDLDPQFSTSRTLLRIHPDGEMNGYWWLNNGTDGCIGIQENATMLNTFYNLVSNRLLNQCSMDVIVNYP